jgi:hypothetical protein
MMKIEKIKPWWERLRTLVHLGLKVPANRKLVISIAAGMLTFTPFGPASPWVNCAVLITAGAVLRSYFNMQAEGEDLSGTALGPPKPRAVSLAELTRAEDYIYQHYSTAAIEYFAKLLMWQPNYLSRVDEDMTLDGRMVKSETRLTFRGVNSIDDANAPAYREDKGAEQTPTQVRDGALLVPIASARKGLLFDDFRSFDRGGANVATLSQWAVRGLLVVVVRSLLNEALKSGPTDEPPTLTLVEQFELLQIVKDTACAIMDQETKSFDKDQALKRVRDLDRKRFEEHWLIRLDQLCASLVENYLIVVEAELPAGDNLQLGYGNTIAPEQVMKEPENRRRAKHGLLPTKVDAPMTWALQADSYHFEMMAPPGLYVFNHYLEEFETNRRLVQNNFNSTDPSSYVRLYHEEGRTIAHLYIRRQDGKPQSEQTVEAQASPPSDHDTQEESPKDFKSIVVFREEPPGGLGNAVTIAVLTTIMVAYFALFRVGIDPTQDSPGSNNNQDIPAIILTLPAFLAAAVGRGMNADGLRRTSLVAFFGLWTIVGTSMAAVLLYIYSANRPLPLEVSVPFFWTKLSFNMFWIALALASATITTYLAKRKRDERKYYLNLLEKTAVDKQAVLNDNGETK